MSIGTSSPLLRFASSSSSSVISYSSASTVESTLAVRVPMRWMRPRSTRSALDEANALAAQELAPQRFGDDVLGAGLPRVVARRRDRHGVHVAERAAGAHERVAAAMRHEEQSEPSHPAPARHAARYTTPRPAPET